MTTSRHNLPWYNRKLRRLGNKKQRLYNKAKKSNSPSDFNEFKKCRAEFKKCLKNAQQEYYLDFLEPKLDTNGKFLFSYIKQLKNDSVGIEAISHKGSITTDPTLKAEAFADQYESVFCQENQDNTPQIMPSLYPCLLYTSPSPRD